jgi:hypothetical protein
MSDMFSGLSQEEREIFIMVSRTGGDFAEVAQVFGLDSEDFVRRTFERVRRQVIVAVHGEPNASWLTEYAIGQRLDVSPHGWVRPRLRPYWASGIRCRVGGPSGRRYPPAVTQQLTELRAGELAIPPIGDWLTAHRLEALTGMRTQRIKRTLARFGIAPQRRMLPNRKIHWCYPPIAMAVLWLSRLPQAGDWLSTGELEQLLGRDTRWIRAQAEDLGFHGELREPRGRGKPIMRYPPVVVVPLEERSNEYPLAGKMISAGEVARRAGLPADSVRWWLLQHYPSERRRNQRNNKLGRHYDPEVVSKVAEELTARERRKARNRTIQVKKVATPV